LRRPRGTKRNSDWQRRRYPQENWHLRAKGAGSHPGHKDFPGALRESAEKLAGKSADRASTRLALAARTNGRGIIRYRAFWWWPASHEWAYQDLDFSNAGKSLMCIL